MHPSRIVLTCGGGGWCGQGLLQVSRTQAGEGALRERHTDFIFCVIGEWRGLVGCLAAILRLAAIIFRVLLVAKNAQIPFHSYLCVGMAAMLIFQTIINIGMCLFIMPVIGITLPFFSYGGSSVVTLFMAMGMVSGLHKPPPTMLRPRRPLPGPTI